MHTSMGLFSSVRMGLQGEFSPDFLHIQLIILKSKACFCHTLVQPTNMYDIELFWQRYAIWGVVHALAALLRKNRSVLWEQKSMINGVVTSVQILNTDNIKSTNHEPIYLTTVEVLIVHGWRIFSKLIL
jgi:hypothetical protein